MVEAGFSNSVNIIMVEAGFTCIVDEISPPAIATLPPPDFGGWAHLSSGADYTVDAGAYSLMLEDNIGNGMEINNDNGAYSSVPPMNWPPENYNGDGSIYEVVRQYV